MRRLFSALALLLAAAISTPSFAALAIVQHKSAAPGGNITSTHGTLTSTPTVGNLVIATVCVASGTTSYTIGTGWTQAGRGAFSQSSSPQYNPIVLYRYVQMGDTTSLPFFMSVTVGSFWAYQVAEFSGVAGTWAKDLQTTEGVYNGASVAAIIGPNIVTQTSGTQATLWSCKYDASAGHNPTFSAGWNSDESACNAGEYGCWGMADQEAAVGTALTNTTTYSTDTNNPSGTVVIVLQTAVPTAPYIRQAIQYTPNATDGTQVWNTLPITSDLDVGFYLNGTGTSAAPTLTANYTVADTLTGTLSNVAELFYYRYVQGGDTLTPATLVSSGAGTANAVTLYEIAGVQGSWAKDFQADVKAYGALVSSQTTTSQTAGSKNALAVIGFGQASSTTAVAANGGFNIDLNDPKYTNWGSWAGASLGQISLGGTATSTLSYTSTGVSSYMQAMFAGPPATGNSNRPLLGVGN